MKKTNLNQGNELREEAGIASLAALSNATNVFGRVRLCPIVFIVGSRGDQNIALAGPLSAPPDSADTRARGRGHRATKWFVTNAVSISNGCPSQAAPPPQA